MSSLLEQMELREMWAECLRNKNGHGMCALVAGTKNTPLEGEFVEEIAMHVLQPEYFSGLSKDDILPLATILCGTIFVDSYNIVCTHIASGQ